MEGDCWRNSPCQLRGRILPLLGGSEESGVILECSGCV